MADSSPEDQVIDPEVNLSVSPTYVEIELAQTISTGDYGSIRPSFRCGFNVPRGVDPNAFVQTLVYKWARWCFSFLAWKQLSDHNGMRENIHTWLTNFFKKYPEAPPLKFTKRKSDLPAGGP